VVGVGERDLDDREPGAVERRGAELVQVLEDPAGLAVQAGAQPIAARPVDLQADQRAGQRGHR
jgi:hypothetical protein